MDYEKAYKEALERARSGMQIDDVFPELKESEDERIRKNCIHFLELQKAHHADTSEIDDCIAYLEKQKEFQFGYPGIYFYDGEKLHFQGNPAMEENPYDFAMSQQEKQKEQKPAINIEHIKSYMLQYLQDAASRKDDVEVEADTDKWARMIIKVFGGIEQKPVTKDGQQECPYKDLALVKDFFGKYKRKCKLSNKACDSKECEQWNELQAEFKRINEAFENGKNEVINHPEVFGLQQPAEWSEEDERILKGIIGLIDHDQHYGVSNNEMISWLKSLPLNLKKKNEDIAKLCFNEWSEEDEVYLQDALWCVKQAAKVARGENDMGACWSAERWLKSLRPQPHWKPSEEQMSMLLSILNEPNSASSESARLMLESLYNDLKAL